VPILARAAAGRRSRAGAPYFAAYNRTREELCTPNSWLQNVRRRDFANASPCVQGLRPVRGEADGKGESPIALAGSLRVPEFISGHTPVSDGKHLILHDQTSAGRGQGEIVYEQRGESSSYASPMIVRTSSPLRQSKTFSRIGPSSNSWLQRLQEEFTPTAFLPGRSSLRTALSLLHRRAWKMPRGRRPPETSRPTSNHLANAGGREPDRHPAGIQRRYRYLPRGLLSCRGPVSSPTWPGGTFYASSPSPPESTRSTWRGHAATSKGGDHLRGLPPQTRDPRGEDTDPRRRFTLDASAASAAARSRRGAHRRIDLRPPDPERVPAVLQDFLERENPAGAFDRAARPAAGSPTWNSVSGSDRAASRAAAAVSGRPPRGRARTGVRHVSA